MKFEYDYIRIRERYEQKEFHFGQDEAFGLMNLLTIIGNDGWELVGEIQGKIIVKRQIIEEN